MFAALAATLAVGTTAGLLLTTGSAPHEQPPADQTTTRLSSTHAGTTARTVAAAAQRNETVGQFNMAGGNTEHGQKVSVPAEALARSVNSRRPAVMTLQETCTEWNKKIQSLVGSSYSLHFGVVANSQGEHNHCKRAANGEFGNSLLLRKDLGFDPSTKHNYRLGQYRGQERRRMLCVEAPARKLVACSLHLNQENDGVRGKEARRARTLLTNKYPGYTRIVGGDLNDSERSAALDNFYHRSYGFDAFGDLKEAGSPCGNRLRAWYAAPWVPCRSGAPTHDSNKLDYLFTSTNVSVRGSSVRDAQHSDHRLLWGYVTL